MYLFINGGGKRAKRPELIKDFENAAHISVKLSSSEMLMQSSASSSGEHIAVGDNFLFYRELGLWHYVNLNNLVRIYTKVESFQPDDSPEFTYLKVMLNNGKRDFSNIILNNKETVNSLYDEIKKRRPQIAIGVK